MRKAYFILLFSFFFGSSVLSQNFGEIVSVKYDSMALEAIMDSLGNQYDLRFSYANQRIPVKRRLTIIEKDVPLLDLIDKLFQSLNLEYRIIGGSVVLRRSSPIEATLITGKVLESNGTTPIPYVHISHLESSSGVITNDEGEFLYWIENSSENESVSFSSIGFKKKIFPLSYLVGKKSIILLEDTTITLDEVVISSSSAKQLILNALDKKKENLPDSPYLMKGFYRTSYKEGDQYVSLLEAALNIYDTDFFQRNGLSIIAQTVRKSNDYRKYKWDEGSNYLAHFLLDTDLIRNNEGALNKSMLEAWNFEIESTSYLEGDLIYKIKADLKDFEDDSSLTFTADVYLRDTDFAIFKIDYEYLWDAKYSSRRVSKDIALKATGVKVKTRYKSHQSRMFLSYQFREGYMNVYDRKSDQLLQRVTIADEFISNSIKVDVPEPYGKKLRRLGDVYQLSSYYSEKFWENYNVPVETSLFIDIKNDLEQHIPLEKQFRSNASIVLN
ncbi:MAG: carboxypeptidase-like regulatory domain-containing protein [Bacteroidota bacterium]